MFCLLNAGSISTGSPSKRSRGKAKMTQDEELESYKAKKVKVMGTCFVNKNVLDENGTCVFQGQFYDKDKTKCSLQSHARFICKDPQEARIHGCFQKGWLRWVFQLATMRSGTAEEL